MPPAASTTYSREISSMSQRSPRRALKTMRRPSGEKATPVAIAPVFTSETGAPPGRCEYSAGLPER